MYDDDSDNDHAEYFHFTGRSRLDTAMHVLHGIVEGVSCDRKVNDDEVKGLIQ